MASLTVPQIRMRNELMGKTFKTNEGETLIVIDVINKNKVLIEFDDRFKTRIYAAANNIRVGSVRNPNKITVCGAGYYGIGEFTKAKHILYYQHWHNMLYRCYDEKSLAMYPTYKDCYVCDSWLCFQNFAAWCDEQFNAGYLKKGWCLDKDIIIKGNKVYSPETSCFVPPALNGLLCKSTKENQNGLGVTLNGSKYRAQCNINGKFTAFDGYATPEEAFQKYKEVKEAEIKRVSNVYRNVIEPRVYEALQNHIITKN